MTAKIRPEEIKEVKDNIPGTPRAEEAAPNKRTSEGPSEDELDSFERRYEFFLNMVKNDSQVGLANLRGALQLSLEALYRALLQKADGRKNHSGWPQMLNALSDQKIIPVALTASLRDIMRLTNRAAHGEHIARDDALDLARLAVGLLKELDFIYHEKAVRPLESKVISRDELEKFESSKYRVTTVVPLVEDPKVQVYVLDQYGLNQLLYGYEESAEFLVSIEQINGTPCASLGVTRVAQ